MLLLIVMVFDVTELAISSRDDNPENPDEGFVTSPQHLAKLADNAYRANKGSIPQNFIVEINKAWKWISDSINDAPWKTSGLNDSSKKTNHRT